MTTTNFHNSSNNSKNPYQTRQDGVGEEAIVNKLHGVIASLRRERDDLHRRKTLAVERLALFQEERNALEKTCASAQAKLDLVRKSGDKEAMEEVVELEKEVMRLDKEVGSHGGRIVEMFLGH